MSAQDKDGNFKPLTQEETKALWHAVQSFGDVVKAGKEQFGEDNSYRRDLGRLNAAKRGLRKVNELRKLGL
jgi:hypothetical protein